MEKSKKTSNPVYRSSSNIAGIIACRGIQTPHHRKLYLVGEKIELSRIKP
jgi:hypothetical protein